MNNYIKTIKKTIPEIKETGTKEVIQSGVYLYLDSVTPLSRNKDSITFQIVVAGNSLSGNPQSIIPLIESIRERLRKSENDFNGQDIFKNLQAVSFTGSLFIYAMTLEIENYKEILHDEAL